MDVARVRQDFPLLEKHGDEIVYLDSACQTLRPRQVIEAMNEYYLEYPACGGRSVHRLATQVSIKVDEAREKLARLLNARSSDEIVITKNCTEALNLVAKGFGLKRGDVVLGTDVEHNSNLVPWMQVEKQVGIRREFVTTPEDGLFDLERFKAKISKKVRMVSFVHVNNVTGTTIPIKEVVEISHDHGAAVMVDGAQAAAHMKLNVTEDDVDFYALSGHKMLGPAGVGVLFGKKERLEKIEPLITGGGAVSATSFERADFLPPPDRFEGGLLNYSGIIGTGVAADYLGSIGLEEIADHEAQLNKMATESLEDVRGVEILAPHDPVTRTSIFSFNVRGMSSHDVAMILDDMAGIMIRSGMHCAHPYFVARGMSGCARASFSVYNDQADVMRFCAAVKELASTFSR